MTEACKIIINYNVLKMNFDVSWALFKKNYFNIGIQGALFLLATTVYRFVYMLSFRCGMKQIIRKPNGCNH
jgi:hypothetical protein